MRDTTDPCPRFPRLDETLRAWAGVRHEYPREATIAQLLSGQAARRPDKKALIAAGARATGAPDHLTAMTYGELHVASQRVAQRLRASGIVPGDRVGLLMDRSIEAIVAMCAVVSLGAAYVPLDPSYPEDRLRFMLADTEPRLVLTRTDVPGSVIPRGTRVLDLDSLLAGADAIAAPEPTEPIEPTRPAYIMFTSGSTGTPKGVVVPQRAIVRLVCNNDFARLDDSRVWLQLAPISFDASTLEIWGALLNGGTCVLFTGTGLPDFEKLEQVVREHGVTSMWLTASLFNMVVDERPRALETVDEVLAGGEALSVPHVLRALRALPRTRLVNGYGPTENTTFTCCHAIPRDLSPSTPSIPIGKPIANTFVFVLDDRLQPVANGEPGELYTAGDGLADGYWRRPELTAERFVRIEPTGPRLYRTGDRVRWRDDGVLEFLGRVDDQVKLHGHRIELGEIGAALGRAEGVRDACVALREDTAGDKRLVAYYVVADEHASRGAGPTPGALRRHLEAQLPEFMIPAAFVAMDRLPITANGKVDRAALPPPGTTRPELDEPYLAPRDGLERMLASMWSALLHVEPVGVNDRFFDLGGTSLKAAEFIHRLGEQLGERVAMVALFTAPTIATIGAVLREQHGAAVCRRFPEVASDSAGRDRRSPQRAERRGRHQENGGCEIAIVGMAGRFPKARDIHGFWKNLVAGVEGSVAVTADDLVRAGKDPAVLSDPDYVAGTFALEDIECFDAAFFGIPPREAEVMDPQLRLMMEAGWAALEHAGHDPARYAGRIGVFGGVGRNSYLINQVLPHAQLREAVGEYHMLVGNERDFPTTHISYRLDLRGPSVDVQTACSTSGVAMHLAAQSLRSGDSDMALVGGCKAICPNREGYFYQEGGPLAPEPHIRAFDARANGMVRGSGVAMLVLKRLDDAIADGDTVYGLLKGSAVNNDGAGKIGFTAPSVPGQAEVIHEALLAAGVGPDDISYIEAHGTGTKLGDPIEIAGLTKAFRRRTERTQFCAIGSVKTNIGHLDAGATAAGVIKTLLAMRHEQLPASLNYTAPNPEIDFAASPFFVNGSLRPWPRTDVPRRAGVSSFGLGGTNAHLILEEAPASAPTTPASGPQLLVLSAKTEAALRQREQELGAFLAEHPELSLADVAHTLQVGRRAFPFRSVLVATSTADAAAALSANDRRRILSSAEVAPAPIAFLFPGGGAQYADMARGLYAADPGFRADIDRCAGISSGLLGRDIREVMFSAAGRTADDAALESPRLALTALFAVEYAMARRWLAWGVRPKAMIGHSMGEYTAACMAGVMTLEDAIALVHCRGRLFETLGDGAMLGVLADEAVVRRHLDDGLSIAAVNRPDACVVAGKVDAIDRLAARLEKDGIDCRRVHIRVAAHSTLVEPILDEFRAFLRTIRLRAPSLPFVSNMTGDWVGAAEATDPEYWVRHLRETVRFSDGLARLWADGEHLLLEVGPGQTLSTIARQHPANPARNAVVASLRHPQEDVDDVQHVLGALGRLWLRGVDIDWAACRGGEKRRRVGLPTYPFARTRHWIDAPVQRPSEPAVASAAVLAAPASEPTPEPTAAVNTSPIPAQDRRTRLLAELRKTVAELAGFDPADLDPLTSFLDLGFDSLFLARASTEFKKRFGVRMTARQLIERTPSLDAVAGFLDGELPADAFPPEAAPQPSPAAAGPATVPAPAGSLAAIAQQLAALQQQLVSMSGGAAAAPVAAPNGKPAAAPAAPRGAEPAPAVAKPDATSPWQPVQAGSKDGLTDRQRAHVDQLVSELNARTSESKRRTQSTRKMLADPRTVQGFRSLWKEIIYPIVSDRAEGAHIWDVDGNRYVDLVNGYGANFFGHSQDFILRAVEEQIRKTVAIGPQTPLAGEVAQLVCEMTGNERAALCNTGSEAVLAAIRVARTVTGKKRLACFAGHYHGIFDEVLVKGLSIRGKRRAVPIAPGIPPEACESVLVMDFGDPASFETIRQHKDEIALVMMEPVRSREPENRPVEFVRKLRELLTELGIPLLFDEMVTGFRTHPGGTQALWGIRADLSTYGKVIGGGFPIGVVAGKARYLDALDGGQWQFGDDSQPEADMTWFAGTFVRHPAALAAAKAVLNRLKAEGPALQDELAARTRRFCDGLNAHFAQTGAPVKLECFSSWFVVKFEPAQEYSALLFHHLIKRGVYTYGGRPAFLTTAHTDAVMDEVAMAFRESVAELQRAGFFPGRPRQRPDETIEIAMSDGQQEIWLATRFGDHASLAFNLVSTVSFRGELDVALLRRCIQSLSERHEALRAIPNADGQTQRLLSPERAGIDVPLVDLRDRDQAGRDAGLRAERQREVETLFDLERGPLVRAKIVQTADREFELMLAAHHIVADGWSCGVLLRDIAQLYSAGREGRSAQLAAPMQLGEWVDRCAADLASEEHRESLRYWLEELSGELPVLDLPSDRPRPEIKTFAAQRVNLDLDAGFAQRIKALAQKCGSTTFVTLLGAFQVLVHRLSGQKDFVVGFSVAGQSQLQGRDLVGHCVNFLPLRQTVEAEAPFDRHIGATRGKFLDAMDHQNCTLGTLIKRLKVRRDASRLPVMSVAFNLDPSGKGIEFHGIEARTGSVPRRYENFDIFFNVVDLADRYQIQVTYNEALWDRATMELRVREYRRLLESAMADPTTPIDRIDLLDDAERRQLEQWNPDTDLPVPTDTMHARVAAMAAARPDAPAVVCGADRLSYAELDARSAAVARRLAKLGVRRGDLVGVCLERSVRLGTALLGVLRAGAAYVPLDPMNPAERLSLIATDAKVAALVTESATNGLVEARGAAVLDLDQEPDGTAAGAASTTALPDGAPEDLAYVIYTSGSTGVPKGVRVTHGNVLRLFDATRHWFGYGPDDTYSVFHSYAFDFSVFELWGALLHGGKAVVVGKDESRSPDLLLALLERESVTTLCQTPSAFRELLAADVAGRCKHRLPLRYIVFGGEALEFASLRPWFAHRGGAATRLVNMYGITETTVHTTFRVVTESDLDAGVNARIGVPIPDLGVEIVDRHLNAVPIGVPGEILVSGRGVAAGYLERPDLTEQRFVPDPRRPGAKRYRSGDLARWLPCGELEFLGRIDDQVKIRGFRIELGEIETALAAQASVRAAAASVWTGPDHDRRLIGYVVPEPGHVIDAQQLRTSLQQSLPPYMVPQHIVEIAELPRTSTGKLDRRALPEFRPESITRGDDGTAPSSDEERRLATIWSQMLGIPDPGVDDDFFDVGGHSLMAVRMLTRVREEFGVQLPLQTLMQYPTIAQLAERIQAFSFVTGAKGAASAGDREEIEF
ncbi:MAG: amino acid adenylation domain-containing protein [Planctomycetota bacterium]